MSRIQRVPKNDGPLTPELLVERHQGMMWTIVNKYKFRLMRAGVEPEDVFQSAMARMLHAIRAGKYHARGAQSTWVGAVVQNECRNFLRGKRKRERLEDMADIPHFDKPGGSSLDKEDAARKLRGRLDELPTKQREALMNWMHGMGFKEMAAIKGGTRAAWEQAYQRGLANLQMQYGAANTTRFPRGEKSRPARQRVRRAASG